MKIVVNVRGINASGKSTAVREYCRVNGLKPRKITRNGVSFKVMDGGGICVIGWYKPYSNSEGCDALGVDKETFKDFIEYLLRETCIDVIVYEKQIWSTTYKLTKEVNDICVKAGCKFVAVHMGIAYSSALNRLFDRNGGKFGNLGNFDSRFYSVQNSRKNLIINRIPVIDVNVEALPKEKMYTVIQTIIKAVRAGVRFGRFEDIQNGLVSHTE